MNNLKDYFNHIHQCGCGSGLVANNYKNHKQQNEQACDKCKHKLLYKIVDDRFMDIFEKCMAGLMFDEVAPLGYEYQWQDVIQEKNIIRSKEITNNPEFIIIECPEDKEYHLHIPRDLAEQILIEGKF